MKLPKYARAECERRWLVDLARVPAGLPTELIEDVYVDDALLRLRRITRDDGEVIWKLAKKIQDADPRLRALVTIYLDEREYALLTVLRGAPLRKVRVHVEHAGRDWCVDRFEGSAAGIVTCEIETATLEELALVEAPPFATREVTDDAFFTGGSLSRASRDDVTAKLAALR